MSSNFKLPIKSQKQFVGRSSIIEDFFRIYESVNKENYKIINYYGMTGIGKTELLKNLEQEIKVQNPESYCIKIDMDYWLKKEIESEYVSQSKEEILLKLRNKLIDEFKFKFDKFDQILYQYYKKIGIHKSRPEIQMLLSRNENVEKAIDIAKDFFAPIGIPVNVFKMIDLGVTNIARKSKNNMKLEDISYEQLYELLQYAFAYDLNKNTLKLDKPLVIFIDTYEMLVKEAFGKGNQKNNDKWIRDENGIISNTTNILWVIAGREELKWEEIKNQKINVKKYKLDALTEQESINLLQNLGIQELELCKQIYLRSEGLPIYLTLCVDQYNLIKKNKEIPQIEDFNENLEDITNNIIRYMDTNDKEILCYLSCMENWTDEFIRTRGSGFITCFSYIRYNNLKELSFIEKSENGFYSISKCARKQIYNICLEDIKRIVDFNMTKYFLDVLNLDTTVEEEVEALIGYVKINIAKNTSDEIALENYNNIKEYLVKLEKMFKYSDIAKILKIIHKRLDNNNEITKKYISALIKCEEYETAVQEVNTYLSNNSEDNEIQVLSKAMLGELYSYLGKYTEAITLLEGAYLQKIKIYSKEDYEILEKLANSYARVGKYEKALEIYEKILLGGNSNNIRLTKRNIANAYSHLMRYDDAVTIYDELISTAEDDVEIAALRNNKAMTMSRQGKNEEAYNILVDVYNKRKEIFGENYFETLATLYNIANVLSHLKRYDEAIKVFDEAYEKRSNKWGKYHPSSIACKNGKGMAYCYKGENKIALDIIKQVYEERCEQLGEYDKDTILALRNLGIIYKDLMMDVKSKEVFEEALTKAITTFGENHPIIEEIKREM